jgi:hypothetical protein
VVLSAFRWKGLAWSEAVNKMNKIWRHISWKLNMDELRRVLSLRSSEVVALAKGLWNEEF